MEPDFEALRAKINRDARGWIVWPAEVDALIGTMPDLALARLLGLKSFVVHARRVKLRRPVFRKASPRVQWKPEMLNRLGEAPDYPCRRVGNQRHDGEHQAAFALHSCL